MGVIRKITKKQYEKAKGVVLRYESQIRPTFTKGNFSIDSLEIHSYSISVPELTEEVFGGDDCFILYSDIVEKISGCIWTNVEDAGYLVIGFNKLLITDKMIKCVLECLNSLE